jgi:hypothetical protein
MSKNSRKKRRAGLRDNLWGGVLGLVFVAFIAFSFLGGRITGASGTATCDKPLAAMSGGSAVTGEGFAAEDASLGQVIDFLTVGEREAADAAFYGPVHAFTHNADPVVRAVNTEAAKALCTAVIRLEGNLSGPGVSNQTLASDTTAVREALRDAAEALGYPRPGGPQ